MILTGQTVLLSAAVIFLVADAQDFSKYDEFDGVLESVQEDIEKNVSENRRISKSRREAKFGDELDISVSELIRLLRRLEADEISLGSSSSTSASYTTGTPVAEQTTEPMSPSSSEVPSSSTLAPPTETLTSEAMPVGSSTEFASEASDYSQSFRHPYKVSSKKGIPGEHFPAYTDIPVTDFSCSDKPIVPGFYADMDADCQVFHVCWGDRQETFLCPVGTTFNQAILTCDYWYGNNCSLTPQFYSVNIGDTGLGASEDEKHESASSMIDLLLEPSTVEQSKLEDASRIKPKIAASALSLVSKFLPVKATVTAYSDEEYSHTTETTLVDEEISMDEEEPFLKDSIVSDIAFKMSREKLPLSYASGNTMSFSILEYRIDQALVQAYEDLNHYFAPLLKADPPDSDMLKYQAAYTNIILQMRHFLRIFSPVNWFVLGTDIWPGSDAFFTLKAQKFRAWFVATIKSAITKLLFEKWSPHPIYPPRPREVEPTKKPIRNFITTPLTEKEFKAIWYLYQMALKNMQAEAPRKSAHTVSTETKKAILKNYLKFFKMNAISFLYYLK